MLRQRLVHKSETVNGFLDTKTKELTTLALSVAARCDPCIGLHAKTLAKLMATRENIKETL